MESVNLVIEHYEPELYEWSLIEYRHVVEFSPYPVIITNLGPLKAECREKVPGAIVKKKSVT